MQLARSGPVQFFDSSGPLIAWSSGLKFVAVKTDQSSLSAFLTGFDRRTPRRYPSIEDAVQRMREENPHLSEEMAMHLTLHGSRKNDDGSLTWKFDNYVRLHSPYEFNIAEAREIWNQIRCPVLLIRGSESWASDPEEDGKASAFHNYETVLVKDAGHWVHHDQLDKFMAVIRRFL